MYHMPQLNWGSIWHLYICIVLDQAVAFVVCKASLLNGLGRASWSVMVFNVSMLDWLGGPSAFYIFALSIEFSNGCSSLLGICAWLNGGDHMKCIGLQGIYGNIDFGVHLPSISYESMLDLVVGVTVCKTSVLNWLERTYAGYALFLDLAVGVAVGKASVLDWPGRATWNVTVFNASMLDWLVVPSVFYTYALS